MTTSKTDVIIKIKLMLRHKMTSSTPSNLSHFQSILGGGFFRKEQIYEQTTRLSGYVRTNSATNGGQAKNFFAVVQQQRIR